MTRYDTPILFQPTASDAPAPTMEPSLTQVSSSAEAEAVYQRLLHSEKPSSEALSLLSQLDQVLHVEEATAIVDTCLNDLRSQMQTWFKSAKRNVVTHEQEAIEAERKYRLRQLAAKEEEIEALKRKLASLQGHNEHMDSVVEGCAEWIARHRTRLTDHLLTAKVFSSWCEFARNAKSLKQRMAKYLQRKEGPELMRKCLDAWRAEVYSAKLEKAQASRIYMHTCVHNSYHL